MGQCISIVRRSRGDSGPVEELQQHYQGPCQVERLPHSVFLSILMLLGQQELLQTVPLVCRAWQQASNQALDRLLLSLTSSARQEQLPHLYAWLQQHGRGLKHLQLSTSTPLGRAARRALLRSLVSPRCQQCSAFDLTWTSLADPASIHSITNSSSYPTSSWGLSSSSSSSSSPASPTHEQHSLQPAAAGAVAGRPRRSSSKPPHVQQLQLQQLVLQMDLDALDLLFLADHVAAHAPQLHTLKLQPVKPSLADLQLLVLACIVGNLVGADAPGPVLPHLAFCGGQVARVVAKAPQLRSLSLSRYDIEDCACVTGARQLTALALQHCSLADGSLQALGELTGLRHLQLADNFLTAASLTEVARLEHLTHLDLSVMPSRSRMRSAHSADISPLSRLTCLSHLNLIGFGVADVSPLGALGPYLVSLEVGLNPLSADSLRVIGRLRSLRRLELGGVSQAWMLSSSLPPDLTMQGNCTTWVRLSGLSSLTSLDLGGSHFTHSVWASHMCPLLAGMSRLQKLMLAHCSIPPGKMQQLLPGLSEHLRELNIDRCPVVGDELLGLVHLTRLTRLSAAAMLPELDNKQAALLAHLPSLQHLVLRSNAIGARGAAVLAKGLTALTLLDLGNCPIGRRASRQLAHLLAPAEAAAHALSDLDSRCW